MESVDGRKRYDGAILRSIRLGCLGQVPVPDSGQTENKRVHAPFVVVGILFLEVLTGPRPPKKFALSETGNSIISVFLSLDIATKLFGGRFFIRIRCTVATVLI